MELFWKFIRFGSVIRPVQRTVLNQFAAISLSLFMAWLKGWLNLTCIIVQWTSLFLYLRIWLNKLCSLTFLELCGSVWPSFLSISIFSISISIFISIYFYCRRCISLFMGKVGRLARPSGWYIYTQIENQNTFKPYIPKYIYTIWMIYTYTLKWKYQILESNKF